MNWHKAMSAVAYFILCIPLAVAQESLFSAENGVIRVTPIVHASLQLEYNGVVIQVDPWSAVDLAHIAPADIILISDDVDHHLDIAAVRQLRKPDTAIIMPKSGEPHLPDGQILNNGDVTVVQGVRIESVAAYDLIP